MSERHIRYPFRVSTVAELRADMQRCPPWARNLARWDLTWTDPMRRVGWNEACRIVNGAEEGRESDARG